MKLFVVLWKVDYGGESLIGVASTEEEAERIGKGCDLDGTDAANKYIESKDYSDSGYCIREVELNKIQKWWEN